MAILNKLDFETGVSYTTGTEGTDQFYSAPQVGVDGNNNPVLSHIEIYDEDARVGTQCLKFTIEKGIYRDEYPLCRSEVRTQIFGGNPGVMQGWIAFSFKAITTLTGTERAVIAQLWDGGSPSMSIRWDYPNNNVFLRIYDNSSSTDYQICNVGDGQWHDIVMWYQARENSTGKVKIWHNREIWSGSGIVDGVLTRQNIYTPETNSTTPYWKFGNYSSSFGESNLTNRVSLLDCVAYANDNDSDVDTFELLEPEGRKALSGIDYPAEEYNGPDYYVKNGGDDDALGNNDTNAFETLSYAYGLTIAGDNIFLKKGDIFPEELDATRDGTNGNPITITNYGANLSLPIISGLKTVTNFTLVSGNIYESTDANYPPDITGLLINNVEVPKGRYPKDDYLRGNTTTTTVTSSSLPSINFATAEVESLIIKNPWIHDLVTISGRSSNTLTYSGGSSYPGGENELFYLQNAIEFLTEDGEWMYSPSNKKIYIYSNINPNSRNIQIVQNNYNINGNGNADNKLDGIELVGSAIQGYDAEVSTRLNIQNTNFRFHNEGISLRTASNVVLNNLLIEYCKRRGISSINESSNSTITNSIIRNIGLIPSKLSNGDGSGFAIYLSSSTAGVTEYNTVENVSYSGIRFHGNNAYVGKNVIKDFCILKHDGAGIYCYGGFKDTSTFTNRELELNHIKKGGNTFSYTSYGVYIDDNSEDVDIHHNLIEDIQSGAYYNHNSHEILFNDNIVYNCGIGIVFVANGDNELIRNNTIFRNVFTLTSKNQLAARLYSEANDIVQFTTINNNLYLVASNHQIVFSTRVVISGKLIFKNYSFEEWQALGFDADSEVRYLNIPEYSITSEGANKWDGTAGSYHAGGSATVTTNDNTLYPDAVKIEMTTPSSSNTRVEIFFEIGSLDKTKDYIVRFKAAAPAGSQSLIMYGRQKNTPYLHLTDSFYAKATDELTQFEFLLPELRFSETDCGFLIDCQSDEGTLYITDFEFVEATVTRTDYQEHIKTLFNPTKSIDAIELGSGWETVSGDPITEVELDPYGSSIVLKTADVVEHTISVNITGNGSVTGDGTYEDGQTVTLTATADPGWEFLHWSDTGGIYLDNPYVFNAGANREFDAVFIEEEPPATEYTVTVTQSTGGTVTGGGIYEEGQEAELTAIPDSGWTFVRWSDNTTGNPYLFEVTENVTISAVFEQEYPPEPSVITVRGRFKII